MVSPFVDRPPAAATQADSNADPGIDPADAGAAIVARRHQQTSHDYVRNAAEVRGRDPAARTGSRTATFTLFTRSDELGAVDTGETGASLKIAVVGGTGAFEGASGTLTVIGVRSDPDRLRLTFRLLG